MDNTYHLWYDYNNVYCIMVSRNGGTKGTFFNSFYFNYYKKNYKKLFKLLFLKNLFCLRLSKALKI